MKSKLKKIILPLLVFCISFFAASASGQTLGELQKQIEKLQQETRELEKEAQKYKETIYKKKEEIESLQGAIRRLEAQESKLRTDINTTERKIQTKNLEIQTLGMKIEKREEKIKKSRRMISKLIRSLNRKDETSVIEIVFSNDNMSDILRSVKDLSMIQENLQQHMQRVKEEKKNLAQARGKRQKEKKNLLVLQNQKEAQEKALSQTKSQKEEYLSQTRGVEQQYESKLERTLAEKRKIFKELRDLEQEVERRKNFLVFVESGKKLKPGDKILLWPEQGAVITQGYGMTNFASKGAYGGAGHYGLDMGAGSGSAIKSAAPGKVIGTGKNYVWGNWVAIKHDIGLVSLYAHMLQAPSVSEGQKVEAGEVIGYEGSTGNSTGSHLHFSVYENFFTFLRGGKEYPCYYPSDSCHPVNPLDYL